MSKQVISFFSLDKEVYEIFNDKNFINEAGKISNGINYFQAIQNNVFESLRVKLLGGKKKNILHSLQVFIRTNGFDHRIKNVVSRLLFKKKNSFRNEAIIFFCENYVTHILNDFIKVAETLSKSHPLVFVTTDFRSYKLMKANASVKISECYLIGTNKGNLDQYKVLKKKYEAFFDEFRNAINEKGKYYREIKKIFFANFKTLYLFQITFEKFLELKKPKAILLGSDGFSVSRVLTYTAKNKGISTYVFQHGILNSYNGYLPLVADKIFVWTQYEREFCRQNHIDVSRTVVVGAPRFIKTLPYVSFDDTNKYKILFITSPASVIEANRQLDVGIDIYNKINEKKDIEFTIRPHPYFKNYSNSYLKQKYGKLMATKNLSIDNKDFDISLSEANIIIFAEISTTLLESIGSSKCCLLLDSKDDYCGEIVDLYAIKRHTIIDIEEIIAHPQKAKEHCLYLKRFKDMLSQKDTFKLIESEIDNI